MPFAFAALRGSGQRHRARGRGPPVPRAAV